MLATSLPASASPSSVCSRLLPPVESRCKEVAVEIRVVRGVRGEIQNAKLVFRSPFSVFSFFYL